MKTSSIITNLLLFDGRIKKIIIINIYVSIYLTQIIYIVPDNEINKGLLNFISITLFILVFLSSFLFLYFTTHFDCVTFTTFVGIWTLMSFR